MVSIARDQQRQQQRTEPNNKKVRIFLFHYYEIETMIWHFSLFARTNTHNIFLIFLQ